MFALFLMKEMVCYQIIRYRTVKLVSRRRHYTNFSKYSTGSALLFRFILLLLHKTILFFFPQCRITSDQGSARCPNITIPGLGISSTGSEPFPLLPKELLTQETQSCRENRNQTLQFAQRLPGKLHNSTRDFVPLEALINVYLLLSNLHISLIISYFFFFFFFLTHFHENSCVLI